MVASTLSGAAGSYLIPFVPVGSYDIAVDSASLGDSLRVERVEPGEVVLGGSDTAIVQVALDRKVVTVAAARATPGRRLAVEGVLLNGWATFGDSSVHLSDATGAIRALRLPGLNLAAGDSVRLVGTTGTEHGQPVLEDPVVTALGRSRIPSPTPTTTGVAARAADGRLDAALVRVTSARVIDARSTAAGNFTLRVDDGSGLLDVVIEPEAGVTSEVPITPGVTVSVTGLLSPIREGAWRLRPRNAVDLQVTLPTPSIAAARDLPVSTLVSIEAVALNGWATFGDQTVHLADATGAIRAIRVPEVFIFPGDSVRVVGTIAISNGQPTLAAVGVPFLLGKGHLPAPVTLSTASAASAAGGARDAALVRVAGATVRDTTTVTDGLLVEVNDGSGTLDVLVDSDVAISFNLFTPGAVVDVVGLLVPRPGGRSWALKPRARSDVTVR